MCCSDPPPVKIYNMQLSQVNVRNLQDLSVDGWITMFVETNMQKD